MDDQLLALINARIDEHHAYLRERLDAFGEELRTQHHELVRRIDAHAAYHERSEHRWGLVRLAERHPFRLALVAMALAWALQAAGAPAGQLTRWAGRLIESVFR